LLSSSHQQLVDVRLRAGVLELHDLSINAHAINEHLVGQPFRLKRGRVCALRVTIDYEKILSESFTVDLEGVVLDFVPASTELDTPGSSRGGTPTPSQPSALKETPTPSSKCDNTSSSVSSSRLGPWSRSSESAFLPPSGVPYELRGGALEDGDELDIIAEWIQLIKARIKVSIRDLKIRLHEGDVGAPSGGRTVSPACVCISLRSAKYYDKTPDHFASGGKSLSASTTLGTTSTTVGNTSTTGSSSQAFAAGPISHKVSPSSRLPWHYYPSSQCPNRQPLMVF